MKLKRTTAIILTAAQLGGFSIAARAEKEFIDSISVINDNICVIGNTNDSDKVTVTLLNDGYSLEDMVNKDSKTGLTQAVKYTNIVPVKNNGEFVCRIEAETDATKDYLLYITDGKNTYEYMIDASVNNKDQLVDFIKYNPDSVVVEGHSTITNGTIEAVLGSDRRTVTPDSEGYYTITYDIAIGDQDSLELNLTQLLKGEKIASESHTLQKPYTIYVDKDNVVSGSSFASIESARDYLRTNLKDKSVNVIIKGGEYDRVNALEFTAADSRAVDNMVTYKNQDSQKVSLNGFKKLSGEVFKMVTDAAILNRVNENLRGKLVKLDLASAGVSNDVIHFTELYDDPNSVGTAVTVPVVQLNGENQELSKWPNEGFEHINTVVKSGGVGTVDANNGAEFEADVTKLAKWATADNMYIEGYFQNTYNNEWAKVKQINAAKGTIELKYATSQGMVKNAYFSPRWKATNLLEELDSPGEWYIDERTSTMYYYPPHVLTSSDTITIGNLNDDIIRCNGARYIAFEGLNISGNYDNSFGNGLHEQAENGIEIIESSHIWVNGCTVHDISGHGITAAKNSSDVRISNSVVTSTGRSGIDISAGVRDDIKGSKCIIKGCDISKPALSSSGNRVAAINLRGVGIVVENNMIHNTRGNGVDYQGIEMIIKNNDFFCNSYEKQDTGAIYSGREWTTAGNLITGNVIHDMSTLVDEAKSRFMVYWDDGLSGNTLDKNIIIGNENLRDVYGAIISQGPENTITNNTFQNSPRTASAIYLYMGTDLNETAKTIPNSKIPYNSTPFMTKYPFISYLASLNIDSDTFAERNYADYRENAQIIDNLCDESQFVTEGANPSTKQMFKTARGFEGMDKTVSNNKFITNDVFVNSAQKDYRVRADKINSVGVNVPNVNNFSMDVDNTNLFTAENKQFGLLYPQNNSSITETDVRLSWETSLLADEYRYQVSTDPGFTNIIASGKTNETRATVTGLSENTKYYWRVFADNYAINGFNQACNEVYSFTAGVEDTREVFGNMIAETNGTEVSSIAKGQIIAVKDEYLIGNGRTLTYSFAAYDAQNRLIFVKSGIKTLSPDLSEQTVLEFTADDNADRYKIFRWESMNTMIPVR